MRGEAHGFARRGMLVTRDGAGSVRRERFGVDDGSTGVVVTRTGRPFFDAPETTEALLGRVRSAADRAGLWERAGHGLAAAGLRAAAVVGEGDGPAARPVRGGRCGRACGARGDDRGAGAGGGARAGGRRAVGRAERASCGGGRRSRPRTAGTAGRRQGSTACGLAPFQVLAAEGSVHAMRDHGWHLDVLDRLCAADPELFQVTRRQSSSLGDESAVAAATAWWEELTGAGGEGMVVKPYDALVRDGRRIVQPGVKCRGPEYLRIIYGPEYLEPRNLERLRRAFAGPEAVAGAARVRARAGVAGAVRRGGTALPGARGGVRGAGAGVGAGGPAVVNGC